MGKVNKKRFKSLPIKKETKYPKKLITWHLDVVKTDKGYEMLVIAFKDIQKRGTASLYHSVSKDNNECH